MPIFMQYEGVSGDVTSAGHEKWIETSVADPGTGKTLTATLLGKEDGGDVADVITGAGAGGGPHVKVFDGTGTADGDGDVDGRDFLIWQRGVSPAAAGGGDLAHWQSNYGAGGTAISRGGVSIAVGDLTGDGAPSAGLDHGVTVLAWARVDGTSPATDDVVVDGRITTGENPASTSATGTHEVGHLLGFRHEHTRADASDGDPADSFSFGDGATSASRLGGGDEDLLIGGRTGFDAFDPAFRGGVDVAAAELDAAASAHSGGVNVLMGDGSVRFVSDAIDLI